MKQYRNMWLVLALTALVLSCKGNQGGAAKASQDESTGFYDTRAVATVEGQQAKAKTVVMYEMPAPLKDRPEQILKRTGYTTSYNSRTKNPNWVAWHLTKAHTYGSHQRNIEKFTED